jgi:hypothetical protein
VGGQVVDPDRWTFLERGGPLELTPFDPPLIHHGPADLFEAHGLALVRVEP